MNTRQPRAGRHATGWATTNAPEVELADTGNEVRITILSKVAR
ncbi:MAG: hypothetical protein NTV05_01690 [Acidobacteria bacterium]|nr:hypothetical protein [Acidobacteriota bacterium]